MIHSFPSDHNDHVALCNYAFDMTKCANWRCLPPKWCVDPQASAQAVAEYDLKHPVRVEYYMGFMGDHFGGGWGFDEQGHVIVMNAGIDAFDAGAVFWHELTHALQSERYGDPLAFGRQNVEMYDGFKERGEVDWDTGLIHVDAYANEPTEKEAFLAMPKVFELNPCVPVPSDAGSILTVMEQILKPQYGLDF